MVGPAAPAPRWTIRRPSAAAGRSCHRSESGSLFCRSILISCTVPKQGKGYTFLLLPLSPLSFLFDHFPSKLVNRVQVNPYNQINQFPSTSQQSLIQLRDCVSELHFQRQCKTLLDDGYSLQARISPWSIHADMPPSSGTHVRS